jgi:hypothetical protein
VLSILGTIHEDFFFSRLVVRDALERDVRHDTADFFPLVVLFALVNEAAGWPVRRVFQLISTERLR